jgi:Uma2 family endonuclease
MPDPPQGHKIQVVPDWICEVLSPSTESTDREEKMPVYARFGMRYAWLLDPATRTLETYVLTGGKWQPLGFFRDDDLVSVALSM